MHLMLFYFHVTAHSHKSWIYGLIYFKLRQVGLYMILLPKKFDIPAMPNYIHVAIVILINFEQMFGVSNA
jgi:hypothetical protein